MNKRWLQFGCFLIGYKYSLLEHCSVASEKAVIKYTSAILLVCLIWSFIGFTFTAHYLHGGFIGSIFGVIVLVFTIIQIERQIILTFGKHWIIIIFRVIIGVVIALIGSIILDQILFKEDIQIQKDNNTRTNLIKELDSQYSQFNSEIIKKELQLDAIFEKFKKEPTVPSVGQGEKVYAVDSDSTSATFGKMKLIGSTYKTQTVENPIAKNIPLVQSAIDSLRVKQNQIASRKTSIIAGSKIIDENKEEPKNGFLDEIGVMISILSHGEALFVWALFFILLSSIEMLVLIIKFYDKNNDYELLVLHQMNIRIEQIKALNKEIK